MGGVDDDDIGPGIDQQLGALIAGVARAGGGAHA